MVWAAAVFGGIGWLLVLAPLLLAIASRGGRRAPLAPVRDAWRVLWAGLRLAYLEVPLRVATGRYRPDPAEPVCGLPFHDPGSQCPGAPGSVPPLTGLPPTRAQTRVKVVRLTREQWAEWEAARDEVAAVVRAATSAADEAEVGTLRDALGLGRRDGVPASPEQSPVWGSHG